MKITVGCKTFKIPVNSALHEAIKSKLEVVALQSGRGYGSNPWKNNIHQDTVDAHKHIHSLMKSKGYQHRSYKHSAVEEHEYVHPSTKKKIAISGWHGTGKWGTHKSIHAMYDETAPKHLWKTSEITGEKVHYMPIHEVENFHDLHEPTEQTYKAHKENLDNIKSYLAKHA